MLGFPKLVSTKEAQKRMEELKQKSLEDFNLSGAIQKHSKHVRVFCRNTLKTLDSTAV